jgi:hypothetical protein
MNPTSTLHQPFPNSTSALPQRYPSPAQTPHPKPQTPNPGPQTLNPKPYTPNPQPSTPNQVDEYHRTTILRLGDAFEQGRYKCMPYTLRLHPAPHTLCPTPFIPNPKLTPQTLNLTPQTLHSEPYTLNSKPYSLNLQP